MVFHKALSWVLFYSFCILLMLLAAQHGVDLHSYADDTQLYTSCTSADAPTSAVQLLHCIDEVDRWMSSNRLRLNADKTQFIWLGSSQMLAKTNKVPLRVGGADVFPLDTVRDLGVVLDSKLTMKSHVDSVARSCFYQLRQLRTIRRSLTRDAAHTLVHAFIHSRVDYCNAILVGVSDVVIRKLQSVLHAAARLVTGVRWNEHITPTLRDVLHWLPVRQRITYKIAMMVFRCVRGTCPSYLTDACVPVETIAGRARLRSARHGDLIVPPTRTKTFGSRSFRSSAPTVWNSLPQHLRHSNISRGQFASGLKTWLFTCAYT